MTRCCTEQTALFARSRNPIASAFTDELKGCFNRSQPHFQMVRRHVTVTLGGVSEGDRRHRSHVDLAREIDDSQYGISA